MPAMSQSPNFDFVLGSQENKAGYEYVYGGKNANVAPARPRPQSAGLSQGDCGVDAHRPHGGQQRRREADADQRREHE